jgi:peroxiredoxin family protein
METEITEYTEPKKKRTEEEYIAWLQELIESSKQRKIRLDKLYEQLKLEYPEFFK